MVCRSDRRSLTSLEPVGDDDDFDGDADYADDEEMEGEPTLRKGKKGKKPRTGANYETPGSRASAGTRAPTAKHCGVPVVCMS